MEVNHFHRSLRVVAAEHLPHLPGVVVAGPHMVLVLAQMMTDKNIQII